MAWENLGTITLGYDWKALNSAVVGSETFRLTQSFNLRPIGKAYIAQAFAVGNDFYGIRSIYPYKGTSRIVTLPIPEDFKNQGLTVRYLMLKMSNRTRVFDFDWKMIIEGFY